MANCPVCNLEQKEGAVFCEDCGAIMTGAYASSNVSAETGIISKIRALGASSLMMIITILSTLLLVCSIVSSFINFSRNGSNILSSSVSLPLLLTSIALWLIYATCKKPDGNILSTAGITIIRVVRIISLIISIVGLVISAFAGVIVIAFAATDGAGIDFGEHAGVAANLTDLLIALVAGIIFMVFICMLYNIFAVRFFGSVSKTARTGFPVTKSALPLAVFQLLGGVVSIAGIWGLMNMSATLQPYMPDIMTAVGGAASEWNVIIPADTVTDFLKTFTVANPVFIMMMASMIITALYRILSGAAIIGYRKAVNEEKANYKY